MKRTVLLEAFKNLARYRSENNFMGLIKVDHQNYLLDLCKTLKLIAECQNFLQHCSSCLNRSYVIILMVQLNHFQICLS